MILYKTGDIFQSSAQVITNTVNCVGVMGKGLALTFKQHFPRMFDDYKARCDREEVRPGFPYLWEDERAQILNFPTKRDWRENSYIEDIENGLRYLAENYAQMGISSIALPPLGCGLGGLDWNEVKNLINRYLGKLEDLDVYVYEKELPQIKTVEEKDKSRCRSSDSGEGIAAQPSLF